MSDPAKPRYWATKRMLLSGAGLGIATSLVVSGKMTDVCWVYALAVVIAGHHAADIIKAWKGS